MQAVTFKAGDTINVIEYSKGTLGGLSVRFFSCLVT